MTFEFKRSLLRVSTLLLLVLFAIVGVGMGYYTAQYVGSQVDYKYSVIGFSQSKETTLTSLSWPYDRTETRPQAWRFQR
ncbi:hypothetical protein [Sulfuracidifex tepidarius]|uniref:hypothetical protein n=1 Tax=Sulfuracidifex tepidarius TaxID=1294262 RepID=UPI0011F391DD|nr:hypothetical protein [Sulfuracidifex tepidarius]